MQHRTDRAHLAPRSWLTPLLTLILLVGVAAPAVAAPWYEQGFRLGVPPEFSDGGGGWRVGGDGHFGSGLKTRIPTGSHKGASAHVELTDVGAGGADELYWRYWLRLDPDFYIEPPNRGKLPGPAGTYGNGCYGGRVSTPSRPCWSARTMFSRTYPSSGEPGYPYGPDTITQLGSYVYHLDGPSNRGDILLWEDATSQLRHGRWYCVEGRVRMNTPGQGDGLLQAWVGGERAFDRRDFRFRRSGEGGIHVKSFWMDVYHGGGPSGADNEVEVDSLVLGPQRVGCRDESEVDRYFRDDDTSVHRADIGWLAAVGITKGCNPPLYDLYCPEDVVSRGQMAAFLQRALGLPNQPGNRFVDDDGGTYESAAEALAGAGITLGCNPPRNTRFCPNEPVTRGQMAAFLQRAYRLPDATPPFRDVGGSKFKAAIGALAAADVTKGCNPPANDRYCPGAPVTREQMASFIRRAQRAR